MMKIIEEYSNAGSIEITSAMQLVSMRMHSDAMLEQGELETLRTQVQTLKDVLGNVIDTLVSQDQWLKVCPVYGYSEVDDEF